MNIFTETRLGDEADDCSDLSESKVGDDTEACTRVGREYQAVIPDMLPPETRESLVHEATLLWLPCKSMPSEILENYLRKAREQHRYSEEQALGMLLWHRHNLDSANADLPNFTQRPDDWLVEEQAIFRQGLVLYSKRFGEIQHQLLRERCVRELVEYYYTKYKLDRAHKLQLNQQKLFGTKSKRQHQWTTRRSHNTQNGHASSNWPGTTNGNNNSGSGNAGTARGKTAQEPQSMQVRNLLSFLSPTQTNGASSEVSQSQANGSSYEKRATSGTSAATLSYFSFVPQLRRVNKPRGLQLELAEMREVISDHLLATNSELNSLQQEYDSAELKLDQLRRSEQKPVPKPGRPPAVPLSDRFDESRKQLLARSNREVHQVRDRMHFNDSVGLFASRRTTQRWSHNELLLLQTTLNRSISERGFELTFRVQSCEPLSSPPLLSSDCHGLNRTENDCAATLPSSHQDTGKMQADETGCKDDQSALKSDHNANAALDQASSAEHAETNDEPECQLASAEPSSNLSDDKTNARSWKYTLCESVMSQLLDVLSSKNAAMIETFVADKMRLYDTSSLRNSTSSRVNQFSGNTESLVVSGSPIVICGDELSDEDDLVKTAFTTDSLSVNGRSFPRTLSAHQNNQDDVILMDVTCAKKSKRE